MSRSPRQSNAAGVASGAPRRAAVTQPASRRNAQTRHQLSRHGREQKYEHLALVAGGAIVLVVGLLLGVGWYQSYIQPFHQTVITVGPRQVSMTYFIKRMKQVLPEFNKRDPNLVVTAMPQVTTEAIESDLVALQRAGQLGVSVTNDQVDAAVVADLGVNSPPGASYATARPGYESALASKLATTGLTLSEYREEARAQALEAAIKSKLAGDYPQSGPQAKYETITAPSQDAAQKLLDKLNGGEDWETLVGDLHNSPSDGTVAQQDFQPKLQVDDKLADPLFQLDANGHTGVITTSDGKYVIARLIEKDDQRPISADELQAITPKLYTNWLDDTKKTLNVRDSLSDSQKLFAVEHSGYQAPSESAGPGQGPPPQAPPPQPANAPQGNPAQAPQFNPANLPAGISTPTGGFGSGAVPAPAATQGP